MEKECKKTCKRNVQVKIKPVQKNLLVKASVAAKRKNAQVNALIKKEKHLVTLNN
ncbi:hypothetical protein ACLRE7_02115 [Mycoplasmopsis meleagridis]|uniref:hypothetical protein n=1 Tax=Mycoplasmopsis meleagridis TaxID=29561 RepID=UPI003A87A737